MDAITHLLIGATSDLLTGAITDLLTGAITHYMLVCPFCQWVLLTSTKASHSY